MAPYPSSKHCASTQSTYQGGFTLIELIASIALLGLLASIFGMGLVAAVESYDFSRSNSQIAQKGQMAMARMIRELTDLTRIESAGSSYMLYERMDDSGASRWGFFFNSETGQLMLAEEPPVDATASQEDLLVDGVSTWALSCFQAAEPNPVPCDDPIPPSTIQISLNLNRPDSPTHTQNFTTLIHLRNNGNDGGARR